VKYKSTRAAVGKVGFEAQADATKGDLFPWNLGFREQDRFEALYTCCKISVEQFSAVEQVDLADGGQIDQSEKPVDFDACTGFLGRFAYGGFRCRFSVLHEPGGESPESVARLNGTAAKQNLVLPFDNTPNHQFGILIVDCCAHRANMAGQRITLGDAKFDWSSAM